MKYLAAAALAGVLASGCGGSAQDARMTAPAAPLPPVFQNGDVRLAFSLDLPAGTGPFPAVVIGHGSGQVTRDQLRFLSSRLTALGFAALRFDKRGVGESTGTFVFVGTRDSPTVFPELASDVAAGVRFLRTRPEIDPRRIGLAGASQAGWILPIAARELGDIAFMVLLSGPVCSVGMEMYYSDLAEQTTRPLAEVHALLPAFKGPDGFDPVPTLQAIDTPALWVLGLEDRSIPIPTTIANLQILKDAGRPFEWRTYDGLGHSLSGRIWDDVGPWLERFKR
jgi:pimeloyl-ACP methyl ester carboxylesterase